LQLFSFLASRLNITKIAYIVIKNHDIILSIILLFEIIRESGAKIKLGGLVI
jgi:hypothetical protein